MYSFQEDFKQGIENLQEERKSQKKRPYDVHYRLLPHDPQVCIMACIRGGSSGRSVEVALIGRDCKVIIPQTDIQKTFRKNELNSIIECIKGFLENPLTDQ